MKRHKECLASINKRLQVESNNADLLVLRARLYLLFCNVSTYYVILNSEILIVNLLSVNPIKWSNTLKQFVGNSRRIV